MATKSEVNFLIYRKHLTKYSTKAFTTNSRQNGISGELLNTLTDFLDSRTQRVILKGQYSIWAKVETGVPQGSILGRLLFLIYINDLSENLTPKLFVASNIDLNNDLKR